MSESINLEENLSTDPRLSGRYRFVSSHKFVLAYVRIALCFLVAFHPVGVFESNAQQNNKHDIPISDEHYEILKTRKVQIENEVSTDKNEWAGTYLQGNHHPTVFMWSMTQGFLTWGSHHTFAPSGINFGGAEFANNRLIITPEIAKDHLNFQYVAAELVPVKWGEQHFLVPPDELLNFAYAVHSGSEGQIVWYFAKSDDFDKSRKGLPDLPPEYSKFVTMKQIEGTIVSIAKNEKSTLFDIELTLDVGLKNRVIKGMYFYYSDSKQNCLQIRVIETNEKTSAARVVGIEVGPGANLEPKIGLKFKSKSKRCYFNW